MEIKLESLDLNTIVKNALKEEFEKQKEEAFKEFKNKIHDKEKEILLNTGIQVKKNFDKLGSDLIIKIPIND